MNKLQTTIAQGGRRQQHTIQEGAKILYVSAVEGNGDTKVGDTVIITGLPYVLKAEMLTLSNDLGGWLL